MRKSHRALRAAIVMWALMASAAHAGTSFSTPTKVVDPGATGTPSTNIVNLATAAPKTGDQINGLEYDFSQGGTFVSTKFKVLLASQPAVPTHIRFRVRAPATASLNIRVMDESDQIFQQSLLRSSAKADDQGWESYVVPVTSTFYFNGNNDGHFSGKVKQVALVVNGPGTGPAPMKGTAYLRGVEVFDHVPLATDAILPSATVEFDGAPVLEVTGVPNTLRQGGTNASGDGIQKVYYDFQGGGAAAGIGMAPVTATSANYARLRIRTATPAMSLFVRVTSSSGGVPLEYPLDPANASQDGSDWLAYTLPLGPRPVPIASVAVLARRPAGTNGLTGTFYVRELELLEKAPSATQLLLDATLANAAFTLTKDMVNISLQNLAGPTVVNGETTYTLTYNFASSGANAFVGLSGAVSSMNAGTPTPEVNRLRFAAQMMQGIPLTVHFVDNSDQEFAVKVFKPLSTVDAQGFAYYSVPLEANDGRTLVPPIKTVSIRLERAITNSNVTARSVPVANPSGQAVFKNIVLTNDGNPLDLTAATVTLPGMRERGTDPSLNTGIALRYPRNDAPDVAAMGFKYVRMDMTWQTLQPDPLHAGPFKLDAQDSKARDIEAILDNGMQPVLILDYGHTAYGLPERQGITKTATDDTYFKAYLDFVRAVAQHYPSSDGRYANMVFEVWNEPNNWAFWLPNSPNALPSASEYAALLNAASDAIHCVDQNRTVLSAGLSSIDQPYLKSLAQDASGALNAVNGIGLHPYADQVPESQGDEAMAAMAQVGYAKEAWFTEVGTSATKASRNPVVADRSALDTNARWLQAVYIDRQVLTSWATNRPMHIVFRYKDDDVTPTTWQPKNPEQNWGLMGYPSQTSGAQLVALPAKNALTQLLSVTHDRTYQGLLTGDTSNLQAMKFSGAGQETVYVVWLNAVGSTSTFSVPANTCDFSRNLKGDNVATSSCVLDMVGADKSCMAATNGRQVCTLREEDGPVYVRMSAN